MTPQQPDRWGEQRIARFPNDLQEQVRAQWIRIANSGVRYPGIRHADGVSPEAKANLDLTAQWEAAKRERINLAFDEEQIRERAQRAAYLCLRMVRLELMEDHARSMGIEPPKVGKGITRVSAAKRMTSEHWWRRQMRRAFTRTAESHLRGLGLVHRRRQVYASDRAVEHRRNRKVRDRAMLQELVAVSDAGDQLELWDIVQTSQANPALRRAELMTRLRGFEAIAEAAGHVAEFVTLTCPSAYHRTHESGAPNERWENFSPRDGQQWLCKMWARARAKLARLSVLFYGFRVAEPHHDGTPHWHMVLFVKEALAETLRTVLRGIWLAEYGSEPGAHKHRTKFKRIDPHKGSACGYVAKYVSKNIDGFEVGDDYETEGQNAVESSMRVAAWASAHCIRQFQQIGGPGVSLWREIRRLRRSVVGGAGVSLVRLEAARKAADAGQWADFITALGGIERGKSGGDVTLWSECTGELNQYEELRGPQIVGVQAHETILVQLPMDPGRAEGSPAVHARPTEATSLVRIRTREKIWRIQRKNSVLVSRTERTGVVPCGSDPILSSLGPVSITVRGTNFMPEQGSTGAPRSGSARGSPWTH